MWSSLLKFCSIFTVVPSCTGEKCWVPSLDEYQNQTWNDAHRVNEWLCPRHEGHAVFLCTDSDFRGKCHIMHIPRGQNCVDVDPEINKIASSISTLDGCTRVYDQSNCRGRMQTFKNYDGKNHGYLGKWNKMVTSVGLCSTEDKAEEECIQADDEGRAACAKQRCYWLDEPNCGENSTCGSDHFMWIGSQNLTCRGRTTKFCCPKSDGHDIVLCQHFDLRGECIVAHIPNGKTCVDLDFDKNDWASSVHSLEGCIKVYRGWNCNSLIMMFNATTDGFNVPRAENDQITSVGLCASDDMKVEGCNRASPKGRSKCSPVTLLPPKPVRNVGSRQRSHMPARIPGN